MAAWFSWERTRGRRRSQVQAAAESQQDGAATRPVIAQSVIPAHAGIQAALSSHAGNWTPASAGAKDIAEETWRIMWRRGLGKPIDRTMCRARCRIVVVVALTPWRWG